VKKKIRMIIISRKAIYFILLFTLVAIFFIQLNKIKGDISIWKQEKKPTDILSVNQEKKIKARVAIIIDDFGNDGAGTKEMLEINRPLTCAVIPFLENTKLDAEAAHKAGHEVIIHIPMEPHKGNPKWLGEKGITGNLTEEQVKSILKEAIEDVPYAVGVNNHMGSKATEDEQIMKAILEVIKERNMYIIDSKTSMNSIVKKIAEDLEVPVLERAVFLDNQKDIDSLKRQIRQLEQIALEKGYAVAIGHVGPEGGIVTAKAIKEMIPELEAMGIEIVPVSYLFQKH
jgi:uncharacterized protein